jgi:hypothetical protein
LELLYTEKIMSQPSEEERKRIAESIDRQEEEVDRLRAHTKRERDRLWALALSQEESRVAERVARKFNELREATP